MKKVINTLFINPSSTPYSEQCRYFEEHNTSRVPEFSTPIGILEIGAYIRKKLDFVSIELLDIGKDLHAFYEKHDSGETINLMETCTEFYQKELDSVSMRPDVVGISLLYSTSYKSSMEILKLVKKKWPYALVICGGHHATACFKEILEQPQVDLVLRGEAELPMVDLLECLGRQGQESREITRSHFAKICGVYDLEKAMSTSGRGGEVGEMLKNLDANDLPAFDLLDLEYYRKASSLWDGIAVMWSRGCPFNCTFCASRLVHGKRLREKSNARIIEELSTIAGMGFNTITIYDDLFASKKSKFLKLVDEIEKTGLLGEINFRQPNSLSIAVIDEEIIDAIERLGVEYFRVSIESGSPYTLKRIINKKVDLKKSRRIIKYMRTKDLPIEANFILGFPGETRELMQETIDYIESIDVDWVVISCALPLPGTPMFYDFVDRGVIDENNYDWDMNRPSLRSFDTPEIIKQDLSQLVYDVNINRNFFLNTNISNGRYQRAIDQFNKYVCKKYFFHVVGFYCRGIAYRLMGNIEKADEDFSICVEQIRTNMQARRMYQRYHEKMEELLPYFNNNENYIPKGNPESISVLPTSSGTL